MTFLALCHSMESGQVIEVRGTALDGIYVGHKVVTKGIVNTIMREDGSGKCFIITLVQPNFGTAKLFVRTK